MKGDLIKIKLKEIDENLKIIGENLPATLSEFQNLGLIKDGIYKKSSSASRMFWTYAPF